LRKIRIGKSEGILLIVARADVLRVARKDF